MTLDRYKQEIKIGSKVVFNNGGILAKGMVVKITPKRGSKFIYRLIVRILEENYRGNPLVKVKNSRTVVKI